MGGRRLIRDEGQPQVPDEPVHDGMLRQESDDLHPAAASGADHS